MTYRNPIIVTVETGPHAHASDSIALDLDLALDLDSGAAHSPDRLDGRHLSCEVTGGFLGRQIGMYAVGGDAAFGWFDPHEA
jgi:xylan 1,4-beta-xylosidase